MARRRYTVHRGHLGAASLTPGYDSYKRIDRGTRWRDHAQAPEKGRRLSRSASSFSHPASDLVCSGLELIVLPDHDQLPACRPQRFTRLVVAVSIAGQLPPPPVGVRLERWLGRWRWMRPSLAARRPDCAVGAPAESKIARHYLAKESLPTTSRSAGHSMPRISVMKPETAHRAHERCPGPANAPADQRIGPKAGGRARAPTSRPSPAPWAGTWPPRAARRRTATVSALPGHRRGWRAVALVEASAEAPHRRHGQA